MQKLFDVTCILQAATAAAGYDSDTDIEPIGEHPDEPPSPSFKRKLVHSMSISGVSSHINMYTTKTLYPYIRYFIQQYIYSGVETPYKEL